jgi:hypothetical protein
MGAGLEIHDAGCAVGIVTGRQCFHFAMRGSVFAVVTLPHYRSILEKHGAHQRIGRNPAPALER